MSEMIIGPVEGLAAMVCSALKHLYGSGAKTIKSLASNDDDTFNVMIEFKTGERRSYIISGTRTFDDHVKAVAEPLLERNKDYKDPFYLLGVAVEEVLETHYRLHHQEGLVKL